MRIGTLPPALQQHLQSIRQITDVSGLSSAQTYQMSGPEILYLKVDGVEPAGGLKTEAQALTWLRPFLPVPEVIFYDRIGDVDYLLIRALPGLPASDEVWKKDPEQLATALGKILRRLHNLNPLTCPFDQRTPTKLRDAAKRIRLGLVDTNDFDEGNHGKTPLEIIDYLTTNQPEPELVVTHGDFCPDNVLLNNWKLSGFIDVGKLGVGDRYQDIALMLRELTNEFGTSTYNDTFLAAYGLTMTTPEKLSYFQLLDELF